MFGQDRLAQKTVQDSARVPDAQVAVRDTNTYRSNQPIGEQQQSEAMRTRDNATFESKVFCPEQSNPHYRGRTRLAGESKGAEVLFGQQDTMYQTSSQNQNIAVPTFVPTE